MFVKLQYAGIGLGRQGFQQPLVAFAHPLSWLYWVPVRDRRLGHRLMASGFMRMNSSLPLLSRDITKAPPRINGYAVSHLHVLAS
jgi:hypothetical protein